MLQQVLVISPYGLCPVYRNYNECVTDPHLIAGFIGAVIPHMEQLGFTHERIEHEMIEDEDTYMEFAFNNNWIYTGIAKKSTNRTQVKHVLGAVSHTVHSKYEDPEILFRLPINQINELEEEIDILVAQKGINVADQTSDQFSPIIQRVREGKMKPDKAAKVLLDSLKDELHDENTKQNILTSLKLIDQLMSLGNGSNKPDKLIELVRATYKNVSKYIVRMDAALDF